MKIKTRIAPSPTGHLHIGTARTALFNYVFARHMGGSFAIRSEDTDRARSLPEYEEGILEGLAWLGLEHDEFVRQSERLPRHTELLQKLIDESKAYVAKEESKNEPGTFVEIVRLKNPGTSVTFEDLIRGPITFDTTELGDFVIARSVKDPLYHFAVVVDDMDMEISHVIRGEDHISNTPRQILIQEALGAPRPIYAHLPLILAADRSKLSKRHGATALHEYREEGFLPEAFVNYMALLGWSAGDDREDYSLPELVSAFSLEGIHKGGAVWDREKLLSVNQRWIRKLSDEEFIAKGHLEAPDLEKLAKAIPQLKERAQTFKEARELLAGELSILFLRPTIEPEKLTSKGTLEYTKTALTDLLPLIEQLPPTAPVDEIKAALMPYADANPKESGGRGAVLWPLRFALSGLDKSPDPFTLISIIGIEESMLRIKEALGILGE